MSNYVKYGLIALIAWNIVLVLMAILAAFVRNIDYAYFFDDGMGGWGIGLFIVLWSLIWFAIGYHSRKKYVQEKAFYREQASLMEDAQYNKEFTAYYVSKHIRMLAIIFITAIPWYILGYVNGSFAQRDFIIMGSLAALSAISFGIYKSLRR